MAVRQIRILKSDPERVVWADADKAARLVREGRAVFVDINKPAPHAKIRKVRR